MKRTTWALVVCTVASGAGLTATAAAGHSVTAMWAVWAVLAVVTIGIVIADCRG